MQGLEIKYLAQVPELIPILAKWSNDAWGKYDPTLTLESSVQSLQSRLNTKKVPLTLVAFLNKQLVGTVSLKDTVKLPGYSDRTLWLGSFIVPDKDNNTDVAEELLLRALDIARDLGYHQISSFESNPEDTEWLLEYGWKLFATDTYQEHQVSLLEKSL